MRKYLVIILLFICLFISGCSKDSDKSVIRNINDLFNKSKGYYLSGILSIFNNDDNYTYDVDVYYKKDDYYKVILTNKMNSHTQIILKNDDGVYVKTQESTKQKLNVI